MDWLLLRGLGRQKLHWGQWPSLLQAAQPPASTGGVGDGRVYCVDNPGAGTEAHRLPPVSVAATAADVMSRFAAARAADGRSPDAPWAVFGLSFGGVLALELASGPAPGLRCAVAVNCSLRDSPPTDRMRPPAAARLAAAAVARDRAEELMAEVTVNDDRLRAAAVEQWRAIPRVPAATVVRQLLAAASAPAPQRVAVPLLVLAGTTDRLCAAACSRRIARRYGARLGAWRWLWG